MNFVNYLNRPEYFLRPFQLCLRLFHQTQAKQEKRIAIALPWHVNINISTEIKDPVNLALSRMGIYDLVVTETLWRLIEPGETAVDVGANIGYMTSVMAARTGNLGKVYCFEPNPEVYKELLDNITNWQSSVKWHYLQPEPFALSHQTGSGYLCVSENREAGKIAAPSGASVTLLTEQFQQTHTVSLKRLDEVINEDIGVIKIDVEGHELSVLQGATKLIVNHQIRDIVFEEHSGYPSPVSDFLEAHGYVVFRIWKNFSKPTLLNPQQQRTHPWEPPSYLATLNPDRVCSRFQQSGWMSLKG